MVYSEPCKEMKRRRQPFIAGIVPYYPPVIRLVNLNTTNTFPVNPATFAMLCGRPGLSKVRGLPVTCCIFQWGQDLVRTQKRFSPLVRKCPCWGSISHHPTLRQSCMLCLGGSLKPNCKGVPPQKKKRKERTIPCFLLPDLRESFRFFRGIRARARPREINSLSFWVWAFGLVHAGGENPPKSPT